MAGAIVDFVVGKLKEQAFQEVIFQWRIKAEVDKITARLANMKGYVEDSSGKGKQDTKVAEIWATQLRDTTLELEDLVEEFMLDSKLVELNTPPCNFCEVKSLLANVRSLVERVKIQFCFHQHLKAMDEKLLALETDKSKYGIKLKTNEVGRNELLMGSGSGYMVGIKAVGIEKQVEDIAQLIQKRRERMLVITVWGAGGCGKTTLAKQVHERLVKDGSIDYCWWVDVNHSSDIEFVLRATINGLYTSVGTEMPSKLEKADENSLQHHICDYLKGKRYVVFFDDVTKSVPVKELIRMCIAEGFINEDSGNGRPLEDIARDYLLQLNNRSLIRIVTKESILVRVDDEIEMHDLFRDVAGEVIRREMFAEIKLKHNTKLEWKQRRSLIFLKSKQMVNFENGNMK
nr:disease resistance protein RPM1-like [Ipomoea batatas]